MRMMTALFYSTLLTFFLCSCAHQPVSLESSGGKVIKDWNGLIDELQIVQSFDLNKYSRILVRRLDTTATSLPPADENTYQPTVAVLKSASEIFTNAIRDQFREAKKPIEVVGPVDTVSNAGPDTLVLMGRVTQMDPGSRAKRYWIGFGAGKSLVEITGDIIDAATNSVLLKFKHAKASGIGGFGGDYQKFLTDDTHDVGEDIGKMLLTFGSVPKSQ